MDHCADRVDEAAGRDGDDAGGSDADDRGRHADDPTDIPPSGWKDTMARVKEQYRSDHVALAAAAVAYHAFLALVPLLIATLSIYGLFAEPSNVTALVDRLGPSVPQAVSDLIEEQLTTVVNGATGALSVGLVISLVVALWAASSGIGQLMEAVNIAYDEDIDERPFWRRRGLALALTLLVIAALAIAATAVAVAVGLSGVLGVVALVGAALLSAVVMMALLATIYRVAPDRDDAEWSWVSVGAGFAVVGWLVASTAFSLYASNFGSYNEAYGALGGIIVVLLWMYISALVILLGAEINAELEHQTAQDTTVGADQPIGSRHAYVADTLGPSS